MDVVASTAYFNVSFVSKKSVRDVPFLGKISAALDCIFLDRAGTKEDNKKIGQMIEARQVESEKSGKAPLLIYPEGATTNNEQLIQFKSGSFRGLSSIQPIALKYWSQNGISP